MATPGPKVADKPKESGLIVDFLPQGRLLICFSPGRAARAAFNRARALVQFEATWV
jgi:hypothetical protein